MEKDFDKLNANVSSIRLEIELENDRNKKVQNHINTMLFEKQRLLVSLDFACPGIRFICFHIQQVTANRHVQTKHSHLQELLRKFRSLDDDDAIDHRTEYFACQKRLAMINSKLTKIRNAISGLRLLYEQYDDVFDRVNILALDIDETV